MRIVARLLTTLTIVLIGAANEYGQVKIQNGLIIGEIRALSFESTSKIRKELAAAGWLECAGQSLKRSDFPTLASLLNNAWGSADSNTFYLPDLRGIFLRGWQHDGSAPQQPVFGGDPNVGERVAPRQQQGAPGTPGATQDHVGSVQADRAKVEPHTHDVVRESGTKRRADADSEPFMHSPRSVDSGPAKGEATTWETRPKNVYVMYVIYVGRAVRIGDTGKITIVP